MPRSTRRTRRRSLLPVAALALLAPHALPAQAPTAGVLAGSVALSTGDALAPRGAPVRDVSVLVGGVGRSARADSAGRFTIAGVPAGTYRVLVRGVGFQPLELRARVADGDTTWLQLALARTPAPQLATVTVRDRAATGNVMFDARRAMGSGKFFDQDYLQQQKGHQISDVLMTAPGVRLVPQPDGTVAAATRRGQGSMNAAPQCYMAVIVDGVRIFEPAVAEGSAAGSRPRGGGPPHINLLDLEQLGGIEVYAGPAQLPAELRGTGNACGAVVIWTRRQ